MITNECFAETLKQQLQNSNLGFSSCSDVWKNGSLCCRFREGLQTLGVFKQVTGRQLKVRLDWEETWNEQNFAVIQVQLHPSVFYNKFCEAAVPLTAQTLGQLFSVHFSKQEAKLNREMVVVTFWRHFLLECEGRMTSLERGTWWINYKLGWTLFICSWKVLRFAAGRPSLLHRSGGAPGSRPPTRSCRFLPSPSRIFCARTQRGGEMERWRPVPPEQARVQKPPPAHHLHLQSI